VRCIALTVFARLLLAWCLISEFAPNAFAEQAEINLDYATKRAEERAKEPFRSPRADMPEVLRQDKLNYDNYRKIRFRHDQALWLADNLPFRVEFFHPGYIYQEPVRINEFTKSHVQRIRFAQAFFDYSDLNIDKQVPVNTGYAGFKVAHPLNKPGEYSELGVFQGASYFRLLGKEQVYGLSARGLAIDCGESDRPEEFPIFTDFWLGKPEPNDNQLRIYAVLDSVSCTGAYEFLIRPGETTVVEIQAVVFFREEPKVQAVAKDRKPIATMGMAPLTSMFWFGENSERKFDDYRPEVHDSDGLLMQLAEKETVWRPLNNAKTLRHSVFAAKDPRGFGLLQRDREPGHYQEIFHQYHRSPGAWVRPKGNWGEGEIHLVEIPTNYEGLDNIVAFFNPKQKPAPLQPYRFAYDMFWTRETDMMLSENRVVATRIGGELHDAKKRQVHIDFRGPRLSAIQGEQAPTAVVNCSENAKIYETQVIRNPFEDTWRVMLKFEPAPDNKEPVDLRCTLKLGEETVSETWAYLWSPP
jgi:periplasmic glucans biosynthesis protein